MKKDQLDIEYLRTLLATDNKQRVIKKEGITCEFKELFNWTDKRSRIKYIRTIAAFANNRGGYIFFGVQDSPKLIKGIDEVAFFDLDDANISAFINTYFSPSIIYTRKTVNINGYTIGAIYVYEAENKPVVCLRDYDDLLRESTIYYRYNSRNDPIKSGDLITLMNNVKEKEQKKWMDLFTKVSQIGIEKANIFNLEEGEINTERGTRFVLDEPLLERLKVIDEYSEHKEGAEAVKIIGNVDSTGRLIEKPLTIYDKDIIIEFLEHKQVHYPLKYIEAMCYQSSGNLPIYYYSHLAGKNINEVIHFIKNIKTFSNAKSKLLSRLKNEEKLNQLKENCSIHKNTVVGKKRKFYYEKLLNGEEISINSPGEAKRILEAILNITEIDNFNEEYINKKLKEIYNSYYTHGLSTMIRQAIAYIDMIVYRKLIQ